MENVPVIAGLAKRATIEAEIAELSRKSVAPIRVDADRRDNPVVRS